MLPLALVVAVYIFLRGHNLPGGGFIAGLVTAVALVLQYMALGQERAEHLLQARPAGASRAGSASGLGIAWLTGVGAFAFGQPFLTSAHGHPDVPLLGELPLATRGAVRPGRVPHGGRRDAADAVGAGRAPARTAAEAAARRAVMPSMEFLLSPPASAGSPRCGIYLLLRGRTFPVVLGLTLLGYAVNVFIFAMGRLWSGAPPILGGAALLADPLPQALVLTAIVIGFATTGFVIELALRSRHETGTDHVDGRDPTPADAATDERLRRDHLPILPVLLPSLTAIVLLLLGDHGGDARRPRPPPPAVGAAHRAGSVPLGLLLAARWCSAPTRGSAARLPGRRLAGAVRHRAGARPARGADAAADRAGGAAGAAGTPAAAGTRTAATSTRCSSSS